MVKKKLKIIFVLENYFPHVGGVEILFKNITEGLVVQGHNITVITHRFKNTKKYEVVNGVKIHRVSVPSFASRYFFTFACIPLLLKLSKNTDIIHTTTYNGAPPSSLVAKVRNIPSVITIHEVIGQNWTKLLEMSWLSGKIHEIIEKLIVNLPFSAYVGVSNSTVKNFQKANKNKKGITVYNGMDYEFWNSKNIKSNEVLKIKKELRIKENQFTYLFYGRPGPSKGFEYLLKSVKLIKKAIPNSKLVAILSKDKAYEKRYNNILKYIEKNELQDHVLIHNPVNYNNLPKYLMASDCVVIPSLTEGFGFTTTESCALGRPVVASNTTSIPEVISGKYILVNPANSKSIANGIIDIYTKKYNKTKIKKFLWKDCIKGYEKIYYSIIKSKKNKNKVY